MPESVPLDDLRKGERIFVHARDIGVNGPENRIYIGRYNGLTRHPTGWWSMDMLIGGENVSIGSLKVRLIFREAGEVRMDCK